MIHDNILESIGNTPLVTVNRLNTNKKVTVVGKLESRNPGGSVKERIALSMVEAAENTGELRKDSIVLEATSGNTGIGLAMVCAAKGYRCMLVMPESASIERRRIMQAYGAEILLTPAARATDGAIEKAYAMAREFPDRYFLTDQFNNEANWQAHYDRTGNLAADRRQNHSPGRHPGNLGHRHGALCLVQGAATTCPDRCGGAPPGSQTAGAQEYEGVL